MPDTQLTVVLEDPEESVQRVVETLRTSTMHSLYIDPTRCGTVHDYGARLAQRLDEETSTGVSPLTASEETALRHLRGSYHFRATTDPRVSIQMSPSLEGWTIICEEDALFALSCAPRQLYIKPIPDTWAEALLYVGSELESAAAWPPHDDRLRELATQLHLSQIQILGKGA